MIWQAVHIVEWVLWCLIAVSVIYVIVFSAVSVFCKKRMLSSCPSADSKLPLTDFLVIFPAYHEDEVIRHSVAKFLEQSYPTSHYQVVVVSDHMQAETNRWLSEQSLMLVCPTFQKSSKAKALQAAMKACREWKADSYARRVVILDADNVVEENFLYRLNSLCQHTDAFIQCHRTAKNSDNNIAALDGVSEEINNTIFRRAHNQIGLSSALIGSGMCFDFQWFCSHVDNLSTAVEDRELEAIILREGLFVYYAEDIPVYDEKVSSGDNFQRQRLRWMTGQVQALFMMMPYLPKAFRKCNVDYIDKTLQQALLPRSILLSVLPIVAILISLVCWQWGFKWWALLGAFLVALIAAIPYRLRSRALFRHAIALPSLTWRMICNLFRINKKNTDFIHTTHNK